MRIILAILITLAQSTSTWAATTWGDTTPVCPTFQSLERRIEMLEIIVIAQQQQITTMRKAQ